MALIVDDTNDEEKCMLPAIKIDEFKFDDWIVDNKLCHIKECFIQCNMTTLNTLKMDNVNYLKLIGDPQVLALADSSIHVAIHKAMLTLQDYNQNKIVVLTQNERQALTNIENIIQTLQEINMQRIYDDVQQRKETNFTQMKQYKKANSQKLNEIREKMNKTFDELQHHFRKIKNKSHKQIDEYKMESTQIEQYYKQKEIKIENTLTNTKSTINEDIKYQEKLLKQCEHIATKFNAVRQTGSYSLIQPNQQRVNEINEIAKKCTEDFEQSKSVLEKNEHILNEYIDNELELIDTKILVNIDQNKKEQITCDIEQLIEYNNCEHRKLCAALKQRLSVFGTPPFAALSYSTSKTVKFMVSLRDNGFNSIRQSWNVGSKVHIRAQNSNVWIVASVILIHKDLLHCLFDQGAAKQVDRFEPRVQKIDRWDPRVQPFDFVGDYKEEKIDLNESWKNFKVGNNVDCKDRFGKWGFAEIIKHKKKTDGYSEIVELFVNPANLEGIFVHYIGWPKKYDEWIFIDNKSTVLCDCDVAGQGKKCFVKTHRISSAKTQSERKYYNGYENANRSGIDLLCIIDKSGSMKGSDRIKLVKYTINVIINKFLKHKNDCIGIVTFSNTVQTLLPLTALNNSKERAKKALTALNTLGCSGQTALCNGLIQGVNLMKSQNTASPNLVRSIFLFTDGEANVGKTSTADIINELNKNKKGMNCTINTFGCGQSHNATLLQGIAEQGNGMYAYIGSEKVIATTLAECIGGLMGVIAQNININIECMNKGVQITDILSKEYIMKYKYPNQNEYEKVSLKINDLQSEEKRDLLFSLQIPKIDKKESNYNLVKISVDYLNVIKGKKESITKVCSIVRNVGGYSEEKELKDSKIKTDIHYNRLMAATAMSDADKIANNGDLKKAVQTLTNCQKAIKNSISSDNEYCQNLINDMHRCLLFMGDMDVFKKNGSKMLKMNAASHKRQRSCSSMTWSSQETYSTHSKLSAIQEVDRTYLHPRDL